MGRTTRYSELMRQVEVLAAHLHQIGVRRGDRVVLDMQNCPQLVVAHFAILRANAVVVPVNPMNRREELKHYITDPDARVALVTSELAHAMARFRPAAGRPLTRGLAVLAAGAPRVAQFARRRGHPLGSSPGLHRPGPCA